MDKWVKVGSNVCYWYECPHCKEETPYDRWAHRCFSRYCPNCGKPLDYPDMEVD